MPEATLGKIVGGQREHWRHCLGICAWLKRRLTGRKTKCWRKRKRRSDRDGGRSGIHRRHERPAIPCFRFQERKRIVGLQAGSDGERKPAHVSRQERKAIRRRDRQRFGGGVFVAVTMWSPTN